MVYSQVDYACLILESLWKSAFQKLADANDHFGSVEIFAILRAVNILKFSSAPAREPVGWNYSEVNGYPGFLAEISGEEKWERSNYQHITVFDHRGYGFVGILLVIPRGSSWPSRYGFNSIVVAEVGAIMKTA